MTEKLLTDVEYNYKFIDERIAEAAEKSGRKREDITFLAATKMVEPEVINHAISLGLDHIGENKVQELLSKYDKYNLDNCSLQFIGHLQTNKVRQIIDKVDLIQSVDSIKLASEISKQALKINKNCDVLVEVNIGREENNLKNYFVRLPNWTVFQLKVLWQYLRFVNLHRKFLNFSIKCIIYLLTSRKKN